MAESLLAGLGAITMVSRVVLPHLAVTGSGSTYSLFCLQIVVLVGMQAKDSGRVAMPRLAIVYPQI